MAKIINKTIVRVGGGQYLLNNKLSNNKYKDYEITNRNISVFS